MKPVRILIADDHTVVRRGLKTLLEARPEWKVCGEAINGRQAVEMTKQLKPDLVIMDVSMPELNGWEATRQILRAAPQTQVLVLTMHDSPDILQKVLNSGARGYVLKSDAEKDLIAAVEHLTQHKPFFTSAVSELMLESYQNESARKSRKGTSGARLTQREREVLQLLAEGRSNKEAAACLSLGVRTIESHRARIMRKLGAKSFSDLVHYAIRNRLVEP